MRRLFTLGLIASTALSLALPAMAAPGDGRGRVAQQNEGSRSGGERGAAREARPARQSAPPAQQRVAPAAQRAAPPAARQGSVRNTRVPPSNAGTQWRQPQGQAQAQDRRPAQRLNRGDGRATNWPEQRRVDANRPNRPNQSQEGRRAYEGSRYENRRPDQPRTGNARPNDRDNATNRERWQNDNRRNDGRYTDNGRRGSNWDRNNWNGRRLGDRERWSEYRRWDNNSWRRDNRYDWQRYRSVHRNVYRMPRYSAPYGWNYGYSRFSIGIFLNSLLYSNSYWIDDPYYYRLPPAYGYLRWVRYYDDALLVDVRDGYVVDVIHNFFW